ncbi:hypothetical protein SLEP1_g23169 [Rubroshorea leprosula]|uniref:Uncharacterized protein n=1 Tax=Rubroshorea leprosula TaxID=152421 RepID=A0AAV5JIS4_9ROSI|nr:hypothetical protein SLEP1_g23169 [Rubroshorea leprosula]
MSIVQQKLHIVVFPWLAYGHILPFLEVSKFLVQMGHRVSYISTPKNISRLPKFPLELSPNLSFVVLPMPQVEGLPPGVESTADIPVHKVPYLKKAYDNLETPLADFLKASRVDWIIHDFAPHWLPRIAAPMGISLVFFCIYSASTTAFYGPPDELIGGHRQRSEEFTVTPEWIDYPSNIAFKLHEIVNLEQCMDQDANDFIRWGSVVQGCQVVTPRSCPEFEPDPLRLLPRLLQKPVVPIGLLPPLVTSAPPEEDDEDDTWKSLRKWLDGKNPKSVFYIALGTEVALSPSLSHELALGIQKSGLPFVWIIKNRPLVEGQMDQDILPPEFEERISDRGFVLRGWAPQVRILVHPSIGGFLTHCGWSSTIEALGLGLPLILFSGASSDLGLVARLLHGKRVGMEIERNEVDGSFTSEAVAKVIRVVMVEADGEPIRANASAMREICGNVELGRKYLTEFTRFLENYKPLTL